MPAHASLDEREKQMNAESYSEALEQQRAGYESYAARYDRLVGSIVPDMGYRRKLVSAMGLVPGSRVLVVACGTGRDLGPLEAAIGPGGRITCVDLTEGMLNQARARAAKLGWTNIEFICADASQCSLGTNYDAALCSFAMSVIPDYAGALANMSKALRPSGTIGILDVKRPRSRVLLAVIHRFITWFLPEYDEDRPVQAMLEREFASVLTEEHFLGYIYAAWGRKPGGRNPKEL